MEKVSAVRTVMALRHELGKLGLGRAPGYTGDEIRGWIEKNHFGSTGFSIRPLEDGRLDWHLVIDGEPHMRFDEYREIQDDETYTLHSPENPEVVFPGIRKAFAALGVEVHELKCTGFQTMWDHDVNFNVTTSAPEWLADWNPRNPERASAFLPRLISGDIAVNSGPAPIAATRDLPVYHLGDGKFALTREAAEHLVENSSRYKGQSWSSYGEPSLREDGVFVLEREGRKVEYRPKRITNFWGDEVDVYPLPSGIVEPSVMYKSKVPVTASGERQVPGFPLLDAQFGDETPWSEDTPSAPKP